MEEDWKLREKAAQLPDLPGVYLMKDARGEVIYCGKAGSLRKRVASYFRPASDPNPRRELLAARIRDLEYIVTNSELEALILESNLIKKHRPRFNVLLRDDKHYPHLCIALHEPFPRITVARRVKKDGCIYFGPYTPAHAMRQTMRLINQIFPVRRCKGSLPKNRTRPCLNHQIGLCRAPCVGLVSEEEYNGLIHEVILFLQGKKDDLVRMLKQEMEEAAEGERYEKAARLRDQIQSIESCMEKQHVFTASFEDQDCFAFAREGERACVQVFFIRYGRMTGSKTLSLSEVSDVSDEDLMAAILEQFYSPEKQVPPTILVQVPPERQELLEEWLSQRRGARVRIHAPQRGEKKELISLALKNASLNLKLSHAGEQKGEELLLQAQKDLCLPRLPRRIEGFDISNLGETEAVGAMVSFQDALPAKSGYRRFRIKGVTGIDDYGMMAEVLRRRFTKLLKDGEELPDLILIDGGKGHLQAGLHVLAELGIPTLPVVSLAKREELIHVPGMEAPLDLPGRSPTLRLLQRIRDEAHRFAITFQRERRGKRAFRSSLDAIPGIGPKRKELLLKYFAGIEKIREASAADLAAIPGMDRRTARRVFEYFHPEGEGGGKREEVTPSR